MSLTEVTQAPDAALPLQGLKDHLSLGSSFPLGGGEDALLLSYLRAALAAVERRIAKALLRRSFRFAVTGWQDGEVEPFPLSPVQEILSVSLVHANGEEVVVAPESYRLIGQQSRPRLVGSGAALPQVPVGGQAVILFEAGFGETFQDVPPDLQQACLLLAGDYYEFRHEDQTMARGLPARVQSLIEPWRLVRILGGGRR